MEDLDQRQSLAINALRFPLIILVIFGHMLSDYNVPIKAEFSAEGTYIFLSELISHGVARITVPAFFLFSGYYFFRKLNTWNFSFYYQQLRSRCSTLLIPYVIWNCLMIIAILVKNFVFLKMGGSEDELFQSVKGNSLYFLFWGLPVNFPLWYLRELICMSVLAPLFFYVFTYTKFYGLLGLLAVYILGFEIGVTGFSTWAIWFFGLGAFLGLRRLNILYYTLKVKNTLYLLSLIFLLAVTISIGTVYHAYLSRMFLIIGVASAMNFMDDWIRRGNGNLFLKLSGSVFFIYAVHEIYIINVLKGGLLKFAGDNYMIWLLGYFVVPFICLIICWGLYSLCKKLAPRWLNYSIGGR